MTTPLTHADTLLLTAPDPRLHREALFDLIAKVFPNGGYFNFRDVCRKSYVGNSHYDWATSRIGFLDETLVTHFGVWGYTMRIGTARVRVGGIGAVATHGDYRKRGLMDCTARAVLQAMRDNGYDMSLLFGIPNFYDRFGYTRAWSETNYLVHPGDLPAALPTRQPKKITLRMRDEFISLYNTCYATTTGTAVRPTFTLPGLMTSKDHQAHLLLDDGEAPAGYVVVVQRGSALECLEYAGDADEVLRVVGQLARKWGSEEVRFLSLPYNGPLAARLRRGNCRTQTQHHRCGAAMVCLLNLRAILEKLSGELTLRLRQSPYAGWQGDLRLANTREAATLRLANGQVSVIDPTDTPHTLTGGDALAQLLLGSDDPAEIIDAATLRLTGDAPRLITTLFPNQHPNIGWFDRF